MSKTQEKRAQRLAEQRAFLAERCRQRLAFAEEAYTIGVTLFEENKDKLSEEDRTKIETMRDEQLVTIEKLKIEIDSLTKA